MSDYDRFGGMFVPNFVAFDLETTGLSPEQDEVLEIALVKFVNGEAVDRWSTLLKPARSVPLKTLRLTGIRREEIEESQAFSQEIADTIQRFRGHLPLVGHNSSFDTAFLTRLIPDFPGVGVYDTLELARIVFPGFRSYKLSDLAQSLGVPVTNAHRAYDDAYVSGNIFQLIQEAAHGIRSETKRRIRSLMGPVWEADRLFGAKAGSAARHLLVQPGLFDDGASEGVGGKQPLDHPGVAGEADFPASDLQGGFEETQPPYDRISREVFGLLEAPGSEHFVADVAGSLDAAKAVALGALAYGEARDARLLLVGFPDLCLPTNLGAAAIPGDYLCLAKFEEAMRLADLGAYRGLDVTDRRFLASVCTWADETDTGSFEDIQMAGSWHIARELACPDDISCRQSCPFASKCFAVLAENREPPVSCAKHNKIRDVTGKWDRVVVWDFHRLAGAWAAGESKVVLGQVKATLESTGMLDKCPSLLTLIDESSAVMGRSGTVIGPNIEKLARCAAREISQAVRAAKHEALSAYGRGGFSSFLPDSTLFLPGFRWLEDAASFLENVSQHVEETAVVAEPGFGKGAKGPVLSRKAVWSGAAALSHISRNLGRPAMMSPLAKMILRSKGLSTAFGIDRETRFVDCRQDSGGETDNALVVTAHESALPGPRDYGAYVSRLVQNIAFSQKTGTQVLFPSRALLREVYFSCAGNLEENDIAVYGVGIDGGKNALAHLLDDDAIVFTTAGLPHPEDPVPTVLVVTKVPFAPPNPVDELRRKDVERLGADPFVGVSVHQTALAIRAHIQRQTDSGKNCAVLFLDPKLVPGRSKWASYFMEAFSDLPKLSCPVDRALPRIARWLSGQNTGRSGEGGTTFCFCC